MWRAVLRKRRASEHVESCAAQARLGSHEFLSVDVGAVPEKCYKKNKIVIINEKNEIAVSEKIIMPGVGHFVETMRFLKKNDLVSTLKHTINEKKIPILGICVGAQIMLNNSEED